MRYIVPPRRHRDPHGMVSPVGHVFVPALIQMPNCILGGRRGRRPVSLLTGASFGVRDKESLYPGCAAMVRRDGQLAASVDENNQTTNYYYGQNGELLDRLTSISYPDNGLTSYTYGNACAHPATTTIALGGGVNYTETATLDGVCHVTCNAISDPENPDYTDTTYDGLGRVWKVSNPCRSTGDSTYGLTIWVYDALGRTTSVTYPDGSAATTSYSGNSSTVTDAAGKTRTLVSDGLGRLTSVTENVVVDVLDFHGHFCPKVISFDSRTSLA